MNDGEQLMHLLQPLLRRLFMVDDHLAQELMDFISGLDKMIASDSRFLLALLEKLEDERNLVNDAILSLNEVFVLQRRLSHQQAKLGIDGFYHRDKIEINPVAVRF